ncbi:polyprenyl synthetase family protein [Thermoanaerobacter wiegelii]|uniref:Polyprenyl synthetase n=1 Tax=Thermoanaerobacter wiegelii Rt8.B1 TaxID=697303 RepID=G2MTY7_9THEO|nr:polyprenyl synthetase family protein [Thermoanaerobacter wiegelii]AEM79814.1 Polyprenyl synthetase [Thermoanaerobacter wiegelii Rt8.B1]
MDKFWNNNLEIKNELDEVIKIMEKRVKNSNRSIRNILLDMIRNSGKMLRPAFVILSGKFGEYDRRRILPLAAAVEMLHMATLVHDDIIDNALIRRSKPTIQAEYGKNYAVFIGDFLFSECFLLLSDNITIENLKKVSKVVSRICKGEIGQFESRYNIDITINDYLKRIAAKTAALFALSFYVGAYESNCGEKLAKILGSIGYNIGMAFQIIDDVLDYTGEENVVGKPLCNDIRQGVFTLPLIYSLEKNKDEKMIALLKKESYCEEDIKRIVEFVQENGGVDRSKMLAEKYTKKAFDKISMLKDSPPKQILIEVTSKLLYRNY